MASNRPDAYWTPLPRRTRQGIQKVETVEPVQIIGAEAIAQGQTPLAASVDTMIVGTNPKRRSIVIYNASGADVWIGAQGVTDGSGFLVKDGGAVGLDTKAAIFGYALSLRTVHWIAESH